MQIFMIIFFYMLLVVTYGYTCSNKYVYFLNVMKRFTTYKGSVLNSL